MPPPVTRTYTLLLKPWRTQFSISMFSLRPFTIPMFVIAQIGIDWSLIAQIGIYVDQDIGQLVWKQMELPGNR
jgi:hypothetical protein